MENKKINCPFCMEEINEGSKKCQHCGEFLDGSKRETVQQTVVNVNGGMQIPHKDKTVAVLLCLFVGYFGIHCFYLGKIGKGVLYMFTAGLFGIGWLVDLISMLLCKKENFDYRFSR